MNSFPSQERLNIKLIPTSSIIGLIFVIANDDAMKKIGTLFECEECHLLYDEEKWARKCEEWCIEHKSCNLEITRHATKQSKLSLS